MCFRCPPPYFGSTLPKVVWSCGKWRRTIFRNRTAGPESKATRRSSNTTLGSVGKEAEARPAVSDKLVRRFPIVGGLGVDLDGYRELHGGQA